MSHIESLTANLPFVSQLLQADVRLFIRDDKSSEIFIHSYYHPHQDSIYLNTKSSRQPQKLPLHKDIFVQKAFKMGKSIVGQYGLVINNRPIQEFAYPIFATNDTSNHQGIGPYLEELNQNNVGKQVKAVIAVERDIYLTRSILGQHWDLICDNLIKSLREKIGNGEKFPQIIPGEGIVIIKDSRTVFFVDPLAANLLSEIAEHGRHFVGQSLEELFGNYPQKYKGNQKEIKLSQRTINLRQVPLSGDMSVILIRDISEIKIKETLLKEIHHRVKNNLQTVVSLLRLQKRRNPALKESFDEAISRVNSISLVHEFLSRTDDIESVDFGFLAGKIIKELVASFGIEGLAVNFHCPEKIFINSENATNLALILNELLSNSLEHAGESLTCIDIALYGENDAAIILQIEDNGSGFPKDFDYRKSTGLGWEIIRTLAEQSLSAELFVDTRPEGGARVKIRVPNK